MLSVAELQARYGPTPVLRGVSLEVQPREIVSVLGPNGAGKSTLIRVIMGLLRPTAGRIELAGEPVTGKRADQLSRRGLALVPEGRRILTGLTVKENLLLASRERGQAVRDDLEFVMDVFPALKAKLRAWGNELSGGQQQMLALGRAIMQRPALVMMDEPSTGLSPLIVAELPGMISALQQRTGAAVLLVEQQLALALAVSSRGYVLSGGRVVRSAPTGELTRSEALQQAYLGIRASGRDG